MKRVLASAGAAALAAAIALVACRGDGVKQPANVPPVDPALIAKLEASLPAAPGAFAPSLLALGPIDPHGVVQDGNLLADVETCATCHPDVTAQWRSSIHSFASFGNPIYRTNIELIRAHLGNEASQHCGGCHDTPLEIDGAMKAPVVADDQRAHTGVSCRVCHGASAPRTDGNGSFVLAAMDAPTPDVDDPAAVAVHKAAVSVKALGDELCVACHRGFLSPDLGVPVHLSGIDEPTAWRSSAWQGNGAGRVDKVEKQGCISCHMPEEDVSAEEYAGDGKVRAHTFAGGHSWMASMRGDPAQLARIQDKLRGAASIDVAAAIVPRGAGATGPAALGGQWHLPADGAPVVPGMAMTFDVVIRNLLVGHRFPGGVADMQDTWIEVEVTDARGRPVASSGLAHARDPDDDDAHVLRSYPVDRDGRIQEEHELHAFRAILANHTIGTRDTAAIRYALDVPRRVAQPLAVHARLRHRTRSLAVQRAVCSAARTPAGAEFLQQARSIRDMTVDPCKPQPITEIAATTVFVGEGWEAADAAWRAKSGAATRPAWARLYEHGMALTHVVTERLDESRAVLEHGRALVDAMPPGPDADRARASIDVQLASVAGKQGRADDALALLARARAQLPPPGPPALEAYAADALARVWRWQEAEPFARTVTEKAPGNTAAWVMLARVRGSLGDDRGALDAARRGLALAPRDPDLLRSQAAALASLAPGSPLAEAALAAYDRFRAPDETAALRMACAASSARCAREREHAHTHRLRPAR